MVRIHFEDRDALICVRPCLGGVGKACLASAAVSNGKRRSDPEASDVAPKSKAKAARVAKAGGFNSPKQSLGLSVSFWPIEGKTYSAKATCGCVAILCYNTLGDLSATALAGYVSCVPSQKRPPRLRNTFFDALPDAPLPVLEGWPGWRRAAEEALRDSGGSARWKDSTHRGVCENRGPLIFQVPLLSKTPIYELR